MIAMRGQGWVAALGVALAFAASPAGAAEPIRIAVFPFGLIDDSQEGEAYGVRADETRRLELVTAALIEDIKADGRYQVVDLAPVAADVKANLPIHSCNGCEDRLAKAAGAGLAIVATVQKVSNLILNLNLYVRDVVAERTTKAMSVDIRGNTDESWLRGVKYLAKNRLLAKDVSK
ncbi:MAG: DUF3280 domain-containing protein [Pseudomonadota bacterium]